MEFAWTDEQVAFRSRVRGVLDRALPTDWSEQSELDTGSEYVHRFSRTFCPMLAEEGLLIPHWPKEYGGGGADSWLHWILNEEMWGLGEPRSYQYMSVNWVGPAIIRFGTPEQKETHLPRIADGTIYYCQGFSEPNAGSDLASLQCKAVRTDTGYVINGQKIWTSNAGFADYCILLVRTGEAGKSGISVLIVPMDLPGVTVRRIPSLQGLQALNEVFFEDVEIPHSSILGAENQGWTVIGQILHNERIGAPRYAPDPARTEPGCRSPPGQRALGRSGGPEPRGQVRGRHHQRADAGLPRDRRAGEEAPGGRGNQPGTLLGRGGRPGGVRVPG